MRVITKNFKISRGKLGSILLVHFSASSVFRRLRRDRKRILLGISRKNGRFRRLQSLLPQKLEGFTDFAEISDFVRVNFQWVYCSSNIE